MRGRGGGGGGGGGTGEETVYGIHENMCLRLQVSVSICASACS